MEGGAVDGGGGGGGGGFPLYLVRVEMLWHAIEYRPPRPALDPLVLLLSVEMAETSDSIDTTLSARPDLYIPRGGGGGGVGSDCGG